MNLYNQDCEDFFPFSKLRLAKIYKDNFKNKQTNNFRKKILIFIH